MSLVYLGLVVSSEYPTNPIMCLSIQASFISCSLSYLSMAIYLTIHPSIRVYINILCHPCVYWFIDPLVKSGLVSACPVLVTLSFLSTYQPTYLPTFLLTYLIPKQDGKTSLENIACSILALDKEEMLTKISFKNNCSQLLCVCVNGA